MEKRHYVYIDSSIDTDHSLTKFNDTTQLCIGNSYIGVAAYNLVLACAMKTARIHERSPNVDKVFLIP